MVEPTRDDIDALVGPATPHFAYQLRARVRELIEDLPDDHPMRKYGEEKMELLDRLGHASSLAESGDARAARAASAGRRSRRRRPRTTRSRRPNDQRSPRRAVAEETMFAPRAPVLLRAWGTSRFPTPLRAHAPEPAHDLRRRFRPRHRRVARHREGDRAPLRVARSVARRHRVHARRHAGRGDGGGAARARRRARSSSAGTSPRPASPRRSPSSGRSTSSSTRPRPA